MSTETEWDVVVLGAGTAGLRAWRAATAAGARAVLVDGGILGTTCARVGCMPSKLLIAAAEAAHAAAGAHRFGADVARSPQVDGRAVMARVRAERDRFVGFVLEGMGDIPEERVRRDFGRFVADGVIQVGEERLRARATVLAVGSRPRALPLLAGLGERRLVNDDVFAWEDLPRSVAVFGPGVIGLELGQALHRLGVRVRIFGVGGLVGPLSDPEVREAARAAFAAELPLDPDADVRAVTRTADGVRIAFMADGALVEEEFEFVLEATGRIPNTDRVGLENTSLPARLVVDPHTMQVGGHPVFVAGDALVERPVLHEATDEGTIAGTNAARFPDVRPGARRSPLAIAFSDPQILMVGARRADLREDEIVVGAVSFDDQGRSRTMLQNRGRLHVYADRATGRLLGAEGVGPRAEHLGHLLAWSHQLGLTIPQMLDLPFYHPVVEEGLRTALRDAARQLATRRAA
jgi:dihydrolipoamide dehydrogenase